MSLCSTEQIIAFQIIGSQFNPISLLMFHYTQKGNMNRQDGDN